MDKATNWIQITLDEGLERRQITVDGKKHSVFVSPFDVPRAVRWTFDRDEGFLRLEFQYLANDEPRKIHFLRENEIGIDRGQITNRIYAFLMKVGVSEIDREESAKAMDEAIDAFEQIPDDEKNALVESAMAIYRRSFLNQSA